MALRPYRLHWMSESSLLITWGEVWDTQLNRQIHALSGILRERLTGVCRDVVPAFSSLLLQLSPDARPEHIESLVADSWRHLPPVSAAGRQVVVPVCYDTSLAPDLEWVATHTRLPVEEVIARHSQCVYHVFFLGFLPGFAYMGPVDASLAVPRLPTPRARVPAGSVGLAGLQTGIYPFTSPGGWRLIGYTPLAVWRPGQDPPTLLQAGDQVRFEPVSKQTAKQWKHWL